MSKLISPNHWLYFYDPIAYKSKKDLEQFMPNVFEEDDLFEDEETLVMCPHCCGTNNEVRNGDMFCKDCYSFHKHLKPKR